MPDDRNAFVLYRQAAQRYREMNKAEAESFSNANFDWPSADATFRRWVGEHDEAISLLYAGAARPEYFLDASSDLPEIQRGPSVQAVIMANGAVAVRLAWIGTAGLFKAGRLRAEGDPAGAWALLNAIVRASRHLEWAVPTAQGRHHGTMLAHTCREPVALWAKDPAVGASAVAPGLGRPGRRGSPHAPPVDFLPMGVHGRRGVVDESATVHRRAGRAASRSQRVALICPRAGAGGFSERRAGAEPPGAQLAGRQRPGLVRSTGRRAAGIRGSRTSHLRGRPGRAGGRASPGAEELARWAESILISPNPTWRMGEIENWDGIDRWSMSALTEAVAVSLFTKETGHRPASPAEALDGIALLRPTRRIETRPSRCRDCDRFAALSVTSNRRQRRSPRPADEA